MGSPGVYWYSAHLWFMKRSHWQSCLLDLQRHTLSFDYMKVVAESIPWDTIEQLSSHPRVGVGIRLPFCIFFFFIPYLFTGKLGQGQGKCVAVISSAEATPEWKVGCWNKIKLECYLELKTAHTRHCRNEPASQSCFKGDQSPASAINFNLADISCGSISTCGSVLQGPGCALGTQTGRSWASQQLAGRPSLHIPL